MSLQFNQVLLAGNLTRDPQFRTLAGERMVANFGLAINRRWKDSSGEVREEATFVEVECWGKTAELVATHLLKGQGAMVNGRLKLDSWEDKKSGEKRHKLSVIADRVLFTGPPPKREGAEPAATEVAAASSDEQPPF